MKFEIGVDICDVKKGTMTMYGICPKCEIKISKTYFAGMIGYGKPGQTTETLELIKKEAENHKCQSG